MTAGSASTNPFPAPVRLAIVHDIATRYGQLRSTIPMGGLEVKLESKGS